MIAQETLGRACPVCGIPLDSQVFDESGFAGLEDPPQIGRRYLLASFNLPARYCGILDYFTQYTDLQARNPAEVDTLELEWSILMNGRPLYPYLAFRSILNPWGYGIQTAIRLSDTARLEFIVRTVAVPPPDRDEVRKVGGRIVGRFWYNPGYGRAERPG
jgi:hypothetical protein